MSARLDADAMRAMETARELARRFRHATVGPEHLLLALAASHEVRDVFRSCAVEPRVLVQRIESRFTDAPTSGLYRDAAVAQPPIGAGLDAICRRAGANGIIARLLAPVSLRHLARTACQEAALAPLLFDARIEIDTADDALVQARLLAGARRHEDVSIHHVLRALLEQRWVDAILRAAEVDIGALVVAVDRRLDEFTVVTRQNRAAFGFPMPQGRAQLLALVVRFPNVEDLFWEQHVAVVDVLSAILRVDGTIDVDQLPPDYEPPLLKNEQELPAVAGDPVAILFHNDDLTTMEFVLEVLERSFAMAAADSSRLALDAHKKGASVVKRCTSREARWRIDKARTLARRAVMPLRITWRPAPELR